MLLLCVGVVSAREPVCRRHDAVAPAIERLQAAMAHGRFIAYQPTELHIVDGRATHASESSIEADLKVLRSRFDGLITYGSLHGAERIPDVAAKLGYRAVIMGVWDVADAQELGNAVSAWKRHPQLVLGISLGNEAVFGQRASFAQLAKTIEDFRRRVPAIPITTTEPFHLFHEPNAAVALSQLDFLLINAHPIFQPWFRTATDKVAADFVLNVAKELADIYCGPILVKEASVPSAPQSSGYTAARQAAFFKTLRERFTPTRARAFAYFSAFDAPWRVHDAHPVPGFHPEEAHFGLYDERRRPKAVVEIIPLLPAARWF